LKKKLSYLFCLEILITKYKLKFFDWDIELTEKNSRKEDINFTGNLISFHVPAVRRIITDKF